MREAKGIIVAMIALLAESIAGVPNAAHSRDPNAGQMFRTVNFLSLQRDYGLSSDQATPYLPSLPQKSSARSARTLYWIWRVL